MDARAHKIAAQHGANAVAILGDVNSTGYLDDDLGRRTFVDSSAKGAGMSVVTAGISCSEYWRESEVPAVSSSSAQILPRHHRERREQHDHRASSRASQLALLRRRYACEASRRLGLARASTDGMYAQPRTGRIAMMIKRANAVLRHTRVIVSLLGLALTGCSLPGGPGWKCDRDDDCRSSFVCKTFELHSISGKDGRETKNYDPTKACALADATSVKRYDWSDVVEPLWVPIVFIPIVAFHVLRDRARKRRGR